VKEIINLFKFYAEKQPFKINTILHQYSSLQTKNEKMGNMRTLKVRHSVKKIIVK